MAKEQHIILRWSVDEKQNIALHVDAEYQASSAAIVLSQFFENNPVLAKAFAECDLNNYAPMPIERTFQ